MSEIDGAPWQRIKSTIADCIGRPIATLVRGWPAEKRDHHARLIVAAPEMEALLRGLVAINPLSVVAHNLVAAKIDDARELLRQIDGGRGES